MGIEPTHVRSLLFRLKEMRMNLLVTLLGVLVALETSIAVQSATAALEQKSVYITTFLNNQIILNQTSNELRHIEWSSLAVYESVSSTRNVQAVLQGRFVPSSKDAGMFIKRASSGECFTESGCRNPSIETLLTCEARMVFSVKLWPGQPRQNAYSVLSSLARLKRIGTISPVIS